MATKNTPNKPAPKTTLKAGSKPAQPLGMKPTPAAKSKRGNK